EVVLLLQRFLGGNRGGQGLDCHQHVEVGGRGAGDQLVVGGLKVEAGAGVQVPLCLEGGDLAQVEHGLLQAEAPAAAAAVAGFTGDVAATDRARAADRRQQVGACLDPAFACDVTVGFGDRELAVPAAGHLIGLQQVLGVHGGRQGKGK